MKDKYNDLKTVWKEAEAIKSKKQLIESIIKEKFRFLNEYEEVETGSVQSFADYNASQEEGGCENAKMLDEFRGRWEINGKYEEEIPGLIERAANELKAKIEKYNDVIIRVYPTVKHSYMENKYFIYTRMYAIEK